MLRIIAGILAGFIVMTVLVMATFGVTIIAMGGLNETLQVDSFWTTNTFNTIVLIGGTLGAVIGGWVCALTAHNSKAGFALAAIVLAMGVGSAFMNMKKPDPPSRTAPATLDDLKQHGKEPTWFAFGKTILGAAGVLVGASLASGRRQSKSASL